MATVKRGMHALDGTVTALTCIAAAVLLWQGAEYVGVVERLAEWQFGVADRYWPTLTVALAVLLALLIVGLALLLRRRLRTRRGADAISPFDQYRRALVGETRLLRMAVAFMAIGVAGALVCFIVALRVSDAGPVRSVDVRTAAAPAEGPARLAGQVDMTRIAVLTRTVLFARQDLFVAPVTGSSGPVRYLVELERVQRPRIRWYAPRTGLLRQFPAARELAPLYRTTGVILAERPYVLLRSADTLRWTWKAAAAQSAAFALIAAVFALLFRRRRRRLAALLSRDGAAVAG